MEVGRSESVSVQTRSGEKVASLQGAQVIQRTRLRVWFIRVCSSIFIWTCLVQLVAVAEFWRPRSLVGFAGLAKLSARVEDNFPSPPPLPPASELNSEVVSDLFSECRVNWIRFWIVD